MGNPRPTAATPAPLMDTLSIVPEPAAVKGNFSGPFPVPPDQKSMTPENGENVGTFKGRAVWVTIDPGPGLAPEFSFKRFRFVLRGGKRYLHGY